MKKLAKMLIIVGIFAVFALPCRGKEAEEYIEEFEKVMPEEIELDEGDELLSSLGVDALLSELFSSVSEQRGELISFFLILLGCLVLSSLAGMGEGELAGICERAVGIICTLIVFSKIGALFVEIADSLSEISRFFGAAVPIMTGISLASGSTSCAAVQNSGMTLTLWLLSGEGMGIFISVVGLSLAMALISSFGDESAIRLSSGIKKFFLFFVGAVCSVLSAVFALQTVVASAADNAAMRAARYAASGLIPVVGGSVSGALSTIVSGLAYAKGVVGAGAIWSLGIMALSPLVMLLLYRFCIAAVSSVADFCGRSGASSMLNSFRGAMDAMIALYTLSLLVYIIQIVMFMKGGVVSG